MRRAIRILSLLLAVAVGYGAAVAQPIVFRPPLVVGQDAVTDATASTARVTLEDAGGRVLSIRPATGEGRLLFVLYPGGLVRPQAYEWLGRVLASHGVHTVIPEFTADLAVTDAGRAGALLTRYAQGRPVVIGGHSLGGVMAAQYAAQHQAQVAGLILMAAYPADDVSLTGASFPALSMLAEHDGVADLAKVRGGLERLAAGSQLVVVPGAVHSFFGRYGPQAGDGVPTVSRADAEASIAAAIVEYLARVAP